MGSNYGLRLAVLNKLIKVAEHNDSQSIVALSMHLEDTEAIVRNAAVHGLAEIVGRDNDRVIAAIFKHLENKHATTRYSGVEALSKLVTPGYVPAIVALRP